MRYYFNCVCILAMVVTSLVQAQTPPRPIQTISVTGSEQIPDSARGSYSCRVLIRGLEALGAEARSLVNVLIHHLRPERPLQPISFVIRPRRFTADVGFQDVESGRELLSYDRRIVFERSRDGLGVFHIYATQQDAITALETATDTNRSLILIEWGEMTQRFSHIVGILSAPVQQVTHVRVYDSSISYQDFDEWLSSSWGSPEFISEPGFYHITFPTRTVAEEFVRFYSENGQQGRAEIYQQSLGQSANYTGEPHSDVGHARPAISSRSH